MSAFLHKKIVSGTFTFSS